VDAIAIRTSSSMFESMEQILIMDVYREVLALIEV
jgi:hypothetical protein